MPELKVTWLSLNEFLRLNMMNSILMHHKDHAYNYCYNRGAFHIWKFLNLIMVTEFYLDWMSSEFCGSCILYCWLSLSLIWWKHFSICLVKVICWVKVVAVLSLKCYCINHFLWEEKCCKETKSLFKCMSLHPPFKIWKDICFTKGKEGKRLE